MHDDHRDRRDWPDRLGCDQAIDLFGAYLADDLEPALRERFVAHHRRCPRCHEKLLALELHLHLGSDPSPGRPCDGD